ncbi:MAG TPA: lipopolysaccharide heptosyltransferase family protein [Desulfobacteraceae bacterium]|nr:lipopolysaccharide heptosyltransferase family protein [Desulfobacteraceae bacterium]
MDILVLRPGALGDTLMLAPAVRRLSSTHRVFSAGREPGISFLQPVVTRAYDIERGGWHRLFSGGIQQGALPVYAAEVVVGFFSDRSGTVFENLRHGFPGAEVYVYPPFPEPGLGVHVAGYVAECLEVAGLPLESSGVVLSACKQAVLAGCGPVRRKPWLVFHPGSGDKRKNHPMGLWRKLAVEIRSKWPAEVERMIWVLGPAETSFLGELSSSGEGEVLFCPGHLELAGLLGRCSFFAGQDSGVTHLAAMKGVPCVALFKESDPVQWRPLGPKVEIVFCSDQKEIISRGVSAALKLAVGS